MATAVTEPVDVLLNLASICPEQLSALVTLVRDGGVVVNTVPRTPAPADEARGVRAVDVFVRSDAEVLSRLVAMVDRGELHVDVDRRVPLAELSTVHAEADAGTLRGKVYEEVVAAINAAVPGADVTLPPGHSTGGPPEGHLDITRLQQDTGFTPEYDVDRAVPDYVAWLRAHES